ncbi:MAG TPA: MerR family transcriptional regulator, partial [Thermoanaerobaculia bacterium]|nr:MerR family transcriptional regulator [Thermoanaerobaculia bacterium]
MAEPDTTGPQGTEGKRTYTLSDVAKKTGISMPTLQRYKKLYQSRIPSVGQGRKQRYPDDALPVFEQIRKESAGRRGRPRKDA